MNTYSLFFVIDQGNAAVFDPELKNPKSQKFKKLEKDITDSVDQAYRSSPLASRYIGCKVNSFSSGSVVVDYEVYFKNTTVTATEAESALLTVIKNTTNNASLGIFSSVNVSSVKIGDLNECLTNVDDCHSNATCHNTIGAFYCTCRSGFQGDGRYCEDINECFNSSMNNCSLSRPGVTCINSIGGYSCGCRQGYVQNLATKECNLTDYCLAKRHNCHSNATCSQVGVAFTCRCKNEFNFYGNGTYCFVGCPSDYCKNQATCIPSNTRNYCKCPTKYHGDFCEQEIGTPTQAPTDDRNKRELTFALITVSSVAFLAIIVAIAAVFCVRRRHAQQLFKQDGDFNDAGIPRVQSTKTKLRAVRARKSSSMSGGFINRTMYLPGVSDEEDVNMNVPHGKVNIEGEHEIAQLAAEHLDNINMELHEKLKQRVRATPSLAHIPETDVVFDDLLDSRYSSSVP